MTTTSIVPAVQGVDFAGQVALLRRAQEQVAIASVPEATDRAEQARVVREWLKVVKGSAELALEATRLECMALRRLGQLGVDPPAPRAAVARHFAGLSDDEFKILLRNAKPWSGALGVFRAVRAAERDDGARDYGRAIGTGAGSPSPVRPDQLKDLAIAAGAMLNDFTVEGRPFSISEVAEELAEEFYPEGARTDLVREGLREVVRQAIRADHGEDEDPIDGAPTWVTFHEDWAGWVRVPWRMATVEQFECMVRLRRQQRDELEAVVDRLESVLAGILSAKRVHPHLDLCSELHLEAVTAGAA